MSVYDVLEERGFIQQTTHDKPLKDLLENKKVTFYIGFDPTADSLHVGSFLQIMAMAHMQKAGHRPIALVGGGTGMVGDPTGKTDMRKMLTKEEIDHNANSIKKQLSKFIDFSDGKALLVNNADWLMSLNYIDFLREVGVHFSVNRMLTAECFKTRMAKGLSFLEFNYMLMQGYDFYMLNRKYGCKLEMGGDDQWSNILAGVDLVRRKAGDDAYGMTFTLLTNSEGKKMGKTVSGAVWLDADKTSPYDFYQYWRNIDDRDVEKCLALLTYVPMDEVRTLGSYKDERINDSKIVLAYELTKIVHGKDEADKAREAAESIFSKGKSPESMPTTNITPNILEKNKRVVDLLQLTGITSSKGEGRRLIQGGGISVNDKKVTDVDMELTVNDFGTGDIVIKKGKKVYHKVVLQK